ncbi:hypothetical protein [Pseudomonas sp. SCA2728.1_7]|jgi:hypothetical protein|uniref:hypothetical protein n=1 Tax=Pseudomonas sp. SCA2728.1_7 TaxID=2825975 RepID=UPI001BAF0643|nr:hypothetical protein [Pseudomonas sp. SCA2728.1_7]QUE91170.1 hypothetical protein KBP52_01605 [Pseudomonas sp. SCA2728.1_7]
MLHLSTEKVREIIILSEARFSAIPQDRTKEQVLDSILGPHSPEEKALWDAFNELKHEQVVELTAMMLAGRYLVENEPYESVLNDADDEEFDEQVPKENFADIYNDHVRNFQSHKTSSLIVMCEGKTTFLHRYLKAALAAL